MDIINLNRDKERLINELSRPKRAFGEMDNDDICDCADPIYTTTFGISYDDLIDKIEDEVYKLQNR